MFLNNLFRKNVVESSNTKNNEVKNTLFSFARKVSMVLGFGMALNNNPVLAQENIQSQNLQQETIGIVVKEESKQTQNVLNIKTETETKSTLKIAIAKPGDSVGSFMFRSFGVQTGRELLIKKNNGKRIINPRTDLIAGEEYVLARNESEAIHISNIYKKKLKIGKQKEPISFVGKPAQKITTHIPSIGFDFSSYLQAISGLESGGNYKADNSKKGIEYNVSDSKYAKGKYQFTHETLSGFGIKTEEQRQKYLDTPSLQEEVMEKFTKANLNFALTNPMVLTLKDAGVHIHEILASMHHMGAGGVERVAKFAIKSENPRDAYFQKLKQSSDWLGTKTSNYVKVVSLNYQNIVGTDISKENKLPEGNGRQETIASSNQTKTDIGMKQPIFVSTVASNDTYFEPNIQEKISKGNTVTQSSQEDKVIILASSNIKQTVNKIIPEVIELKDVTKNTEVSPIIKAQYKKQLLSMIASNMSLSKDFRDTLVEKLSKVDDLHAYYQTQIDHYNTVLATSNNDLEKQRAKRILPGIIKLLQDTSRMVASANEGYTVIKKSA